MAMLWKRLQIAAKEEATEGTPETLDAPDVLLASNVSYDPEIAMSNRPAASKSLSPWPKVAGARQAKVSFDVELKGSGAAGTPPEYGHLLKASGMEETIVAGTSVTYDPASDSVVSLTVGWLVDGKKYEVAGCRGTWKLDLKAGEPGVFHFEFTGTNISDADLNLLAGVTYQSTSPPPFQNANFMLDAYTAIIESLSIDMANTIGLRPSANAPQGYVSAIITGREPKLTLDPEDVLVSTKDWWQLWETGSLVALSAQVGATAGNICAISAPKVQIIGTKPRERNGIAIQEMECELKRDSGDDELSLQFT